MEVIRSRSPYFVEINETNQTSTRVELFIWHKGEIEPSLPTYELSKVASSPTQRKNVYNIAPFIKENIEIISPTLTDSVDVESNNNWCYCKVKKYATVSSVESLIDTTTYIGLNGYTDYSGGFNQSNVDNIQVLINPEIKRTYNTRIGVSDGSYFNLLIQKTIPTDNIEVRYYNVIAGLIGTLIDTVALVSDNDYLYRVPYVLDDIDLNNGAFVIVYNVSDDIEIARIYSEPLCEPKYTPVLCSFFNAFGGWGFITFFKAKSESYETKSKDFSLLPNDVDYNPLRGQTQKFNFESKKSVKVNTGWVDENYSILLEQLFNSETVLLDNVPVILKTSSFQIKTHLKDRVINYELDFEYDFNQINNVQ